MLLFLSLAEKYLIFSIGAQPMQNQTCLPKTGCFCPSQTPTDIFEDILVTGESSHLHCLFIHFCSQESLGLSFLLDDKKQTI